MAIERGVEVMERELAAESPKENPRPARQAGEEPSIQAAEVERASPLPGVA